MPEEAANLAVHQHRITQNCADTNTHLLIKRACTTHQAGLRSPGLARVQQRNEQPEDTVELSGNTVRLSTIKLLKATSKQRSPLPLPTRCNAATSRRKSCAQRSEGVTIR
jgi:hypothetical protein